MPTAKITNKHLSKLQQIAKALGGTPSDAFAIAIDAAHAKHCGSSDGEGATDLDEDAEAEPGEIGADDEDSILPGMKTVTDNPREKRAKQMLAARQANFATAMNAAGAEPGNAKRAVASMNERIAKEGDDLPPGKRTGKPNPLAQWARTPGSRNAMPRPQRRG